MPNSPAYFTADGAKLIPSGTLFKSDGEPVVVAGMSESFLSEDFVGGATTGNLGWSAVAANSGTVTVTTGEVDAPGIIRMTTVTSTSAQAAVRLGVSAFLLGGGALTYSWRVRVNALSTVTDEYSFRVGLGDSTTGEHTDGVYFCYDRATDGDFWSIKTASNSSVTKTVTSSAVTAAAWVRLTAVVNAAGTSVTFSINGASVGTHTTNIPVGAGRHCAPVVAKVRSAGTASVTADADYYWHYQKLTSAR
jgi:hypothetical protein